MGNFRDDIHRTTSTFSIETESDFRTFFNQYAPVVFRTASRYLESDDLAQDIVQEVFTTIWLRRNTLHEIDNIEHYLTSMARNRTFRELKNWSLEYDSRQAYYQNRNPEFVDYEAPPEHPYSELLLEVVGLLPAQQKRVFELGKYDGLTHEAIAQHMKLSPGTVKNHMVRALKFIRERLSPPAGMLMFFLFQ